MQECHAFYGTQPQQRLLSRKSRWLRVGDLPFSRGHVYRLILEGILFSVEMRIPGSARSVRLIDGERLDHYLLKLGREQQEQREKSKSSPMKDTKQRPAVA